MTKYEKEQLAIAKANIKAIMKKHKLNSDDNREMILMLKEYLFFLAGVQYEKHRIRLCYWEAAFEVYNYLRKTHQLERRVVGMRQDIVGGMHKALCDLFGEIKKL
ncbi:MAG: hypothetical protein II404_02120 [Prevotella sp.]|nr:hypothetical protein [Prevotella sp.]